MENTSIYTFLDKQQQARLVASQKLCQSLDYQFNRNELLVEALTHSSLISEIKRAKSWDKRRLVWNERLEFLGDSVLGLSISSALLAKPEGFPEGVLSKIRAALVSEASLAEHARRIELGEFLLLGSGEDKSGGRNKDSVLADALEAVFGAIYLDSGFEAAQAIILRLFEAKLSSKLSQLIQKDYKTRLQEFMQAMYKQTPEYKIADKHGPDHDSSFIVEVSFKDRLLGIGKGSSKKQASQDAAKKALSLLKEENKGLGSINE